MLLRTVPTPEEIYEASLAAAEGPVDIDGLITAHPQHANALRSLHRQQEKADKLLARGFEETESMIASRDLGVEIREELGRGGFGCVYRAFDLGLQREVALKVLSDNSCIGAIAQERFLREARVLASLDHPNIVRIYSVDKKEGRLRLVMELIKGSTLAAIVKREGPLAPEEAARVGVDLCRALAAIHEKRLVHMDVKPGNVMRGERGRIVLLDFGFARDVVAGDAGPVGGTPYFCAPEQLEPSGEIGPGADVYALGVTLYWLVSGSYPHEAKDYAELRRLVLEAPGRPLLDVAPNIDAAFAEIVSRATERSPDDRFSSAGEFEKALRKFLSGDGGASDREPSDRSMARRSVPVFIAASLLAIAVIFLTRSPSTSRLQLDYQFSLGTEAEPTPLGEGDRIRTGDRLFMTTRAEQPYYLYVFNEDMLGRMHTLFPTKQRANPVPGDEQQRFPASGHWVVDTEGGGSELFYVIAASQPVAEAESISQMLEPLRYVDLPASVRDGLERGVGSTTEVSGSAFASLGELIDALGRARPDVFVDRLELSH